MEREFMKKGELKGDLQKRKLKREITKVGKEKLPANPVQTISSGVFTIFITVRVSILFHPILSNLSATSVF